VPVPPAELTAELTVSGPDAARSALREVAAASGLALDAGPGETMLSGSRAAVLGALGDAVQAALDAGAHGLDVRLEAPTESR
jgi:uncharacterized protein YqgV (UPF0045/DUF77 family)